MHVALGQWSDDPRRVQFDKIERMAMAITFSELEGAEFDFGSMSWKKPV
jgi:hypothetical protein